MLATAGQRWTSLRELRLDSSTRPPPRRGSGPMGASPPAAFAHGCAARRRELRDSGVLSEDGLRRVRPEPGRPPSDGRGRLGRRLVDDRLGPRGHRPAGGASAGQRLRRPRAEISARAAVPSWSTWRAGARCWPTPHRCPRLRPAGLRGLPGGMGGLPDAPWPRASTSDAERRSASWAHPDRVRPHRRARPRPASGRGRRRGPGHPRGSDRSAARRRSPGRQR